MAGLGTAVAHQAKAAAGATEPITGYQGLCLDDRSASTADFNPADHGNSGTVGWTTNTAANGLAVNGANVTMYGLAVEHYQAVQVQWNGNGGADYFYQSEMPYDPPSQSAWMDGSSDGYPSIAVANSVTSFQAYGLGVYCFFDVTPSVVSATALRISTRLPSANGSVPGRAVRPHPFGIIQIVCPNGCVAPAYTPATAAGFAPVMRRTATALKSPSCCRVRR